DSDCDGGKQSSHGPPPAIHRCALAATRKDSKQAALLYHLGGPSEQPIRHGQAERLRGLEVDNQKPRVPDAVQRETKCSGAPLIRTATDWDDPGSAAHHFASLVLRCARDTLLKLTPMTPSPRRFAPGEGSRPSGRTCYLNTCADTRGVAAHH